MIGKVLHGTGVTGLLRYLYSESPAQQAELGGRSRHENPRIVGAWDDPDGLEPVKSPDGRRDFRALSAALRAPLACADMDAADRGVYHLILRNSAEDRVLSDGEWGEV